MSSPKFVNMEPPTVGTTMNNRLFRRLIVSAYACVFASLLSCTSGENIPRTNSSAAETRRQQSNRETSSPIPESDPQRPVRNPSVSANDGHSRASEPGDESNAAIALDNIGFSIVDPDDHTGIDGWESESVSDLASRQLQRLAALLTHRGPVVEDDIAELADPSITYTPLRPIDLDRVFQDTTIEVWRARQPKVLAGNGMVEQAGASGFVRALNRLATPLDSGENLKAEFKIFRVNVALDGLATVAHFELSGTMDGGNVQQTGLWHCQWRRREKALPLLTAVRVEDFEESRTRGPNGKWFADRTEAVMKNAACFREQLAFGVDHWTGRVDKRLGMTASGWQGLAIGDVNGDGLDDVYVCQPGGLPNRLLVQQQDGTVIDTSRQAGVDWLDETQSALFVDLDNDGNQDLIVSVGSGLIIMQGNGSGEFQLRATKLLPEAAAFSLAAADFDEDGDLDVYCCGYAVRRQRLPGDTFGRPVPYHDANNGGRNVLFRNDRKWRFRDVTKSVGLDENNRRFSFAAAWEDFDNDGDLDLYVANDYGRNNLYRYDRDAGRFRDVAREAGVEDISAGMSVTWGDYNNDGLMDLYVSNMWSAAGNRIAYQRRFHSQASEETRAELQRHARGNSLFRNGGDGRFYDVSEEAGVTMGRWAWGSLFADVNNDGLEDLLVANGFITQQDTGDL